LFTIPFIDNVAVKGPVTCYESPDGTYETIPENTSIRCFIWEHLAKRQLYLAMPQVYQQHILWQKT
jgi:hypothetical protein